MPVEEVTTINITCDGPKCKGHDDLDPHDRMGWLFVTHEVYGQPSKQNVFGSAQCVSDAAADVADPKLFGPEPQPAPEESVAESVPSG